MAALTAPTTATTGSIKDYFSLAPKKVVDVVDVIEEEEVTPSSPPLEISGRLSSTDSAPGTPPSEAEGEETAEGVLEQQVGGF